MASAVDGLVSGLQTSTIIRQLMQLEAQPQTALKARLSSTRTDATSYRAVNTRFDSLRTAAEALTKPGAFTATKASSSSTSVSATAAATAATGSLTFEVTQVATTHAQVSTGTWGSTTAAYGLTSPITVYAKDGTTVRGTIDVVSSSTTGDPASLADAVAAINASPLGFNASAVKTGEGSYKLQVASKASGLASSFSLGGDFTDNSLGQDATIKVGSVSPYEVSSSTNTFTDTVPGVTFTVSKPEAGVTVSVAADPAAIAAKVKSMVDAANEALKTVAAYTDSTSDSALLKGDSTLRSLANQVLDAVSSAVGTASASQIGLQLSRTGSLTFDTAKFSAALAADPALAQKVAGGTVAGKGVDGLTGTADDVAAVDGIAARLLAVAQRASDTTTGSLVKLAEAKDTAAKDFQTRIDAYDVRLTSRRAALEKYYTNLETSLGRLQNQSSWLAGQLNNLPRWSK